MSYHAAILEQFVGKTVGDGSDVAYVRAVTIAPSSGIWRSGERVRDSLNLLKGTAIATFMAGHYYDGAAGNWAAIYLSQDASGIRVLCQEAGYPVHEEVIPWTAPAAENAGELFHVIE